MRMRIGLKNKWIKALRSGKYKQGIGVLYDAKDKTFCCLGVLEHICMDGNVEIYVDPATKPTQPPRYKNLPTAAFYEAYHIDADKKYYGKGSLGATWDQAITKLSAMNDDGATDFNDIADYIEETVEVIQ